VSAVEREPGVRDPDPPERELGAGELGPGRQRRRHGGGGHVDCGQRLLGGFELADEDLRLRGEGTLFDIRQSGLPDLKLAKLSDDADLVHRAREWAFAVIDSDRELSRHPELMDLLRHTFTGEAIEWLFHS